MGQQSAFDVWETVRAMGDLSPEQAKALADELAELSKQHAEALETGAYINMSKKELSEYDQRRKRIGEIGALLGKYRPTK